MYKSESFCYLATVRSNFLYTRFTADISVCPPCNKEKVHVRPRIPIRYTILSFGHLMCGDIALLLDVSIIKNELGIVLYGSKDIHH